MISNEFIIKLNEIITSSPVISKKLGISSESLPALQEKLAQCQALMRTVNQDPTPYSTNVLTILKKTFDFLEEDLDTRLDQLAGQQNPMTFIGLIIQALRLAYELPNGETYTNYNVRIFFELYSRCGGEQTLTQAQWNEWQAKLLWTQGLIHSFMSAHEDFSESVSTLTIQPPPALSRMRSLRAPLASITENIPPRHAIARRAVTWLWNARLGEEARAERKPLTALSCSLQARKN